MLMRSELKAMLSLALPVILSELGWIMMGIVDTLMVSPLGPAAIGAVGTGSTIFMSVMIFGMGTLFALDTYVSQSFGAGRIDECHRWLFAGVQLAAILAVFLTLLLVGVVMVLPAFGFHPDVLAVIQPYIARLVLSAAPLLAYAVFRRYLQAMNVVRPVMVALISANLINAFGNWLLVFGHWGAPALGTNGSAYATLAARIYLAIFLFVVIWQRERKNPSGLHDVPFVIDAQRMWRVVRLGVPAALQITLEIGVFAMASALTGRISPLAIAANQVVLNIASFVFMIPLGLSSAAAVRVGQAIGRKDPPGVRLAGKSAFWLASVFMIATAALYVVMPRQLLGIFTTDDAVLRIGTTVLYIYGALQLFDAWQVVATGALRGLGDTRTPMLLNLVGHWIIGLPLGYWLCFNRDWGVAGLWSGLSVGLTIVGVVLAGVWRHRSRALTFGGIA
ncbi:MAG: MATE family efflux transporter [Acidobacteria bacterium]|nr:MATE family efflux transporter [Acidobacteriota bacterium]